MKMKLDVMYAMMANRPEDAFVDIDTQAWVEDENIELYNEFRSKVTNAINKPKALIKEK